MSSLQQSSLPRPKFGMKGADESWLRTNMHKDLVKICHKYKDKKWLRKNQHAYCIYYACHVLGSLCIVADGAAYKILQETDIIETLLSLWKGEKTWFESRSAARAIANVFANDSQLVHRFTNNKQNINVVQLAMKQYTECVRFVIKHGMIKPDKMAGYVQDLVLKVKNCSNYYGDDVLRSCALKCAQNWMHYNGSLLSHVSQGNLSAEVEDLFVDVELELWEKACSMDLCYYWFLENDFVDTFLDSLIYLTKNKKCAKIISKSDFIIRALILKLRSRTCLENRYDFIIFNLLKLNLFPIKYYSDLCLSLMLLLDLDRRYYYIKMFGNYKANIFESIINSIKLLFNIPIQFEFMEPNKKLKKFKCCSCNEILRNPHKIPCGHHYCYVCILGLKIDHSNAKCLVNNCQKKDFKFTLEHEKFDFKISNEINAIQRKIVINNGKDTFTGTLNDCWQFIKNNLDITMINKLNKDFEYFCHYMIKETAIRTGKDFKKLRIEGRNIRAKGNEHFKNKQYEKAIQCYINALNVCPNKYGDDRMTYYSNLSIAYYKMNEYFKAYKSSLSGLAYNYKHMKLSNILAKCYSKLNASKLFSKNIIDYDVLDNDLYLNKVQTVVLFNFYSGFKGVYISTKVKQNSTETAFEKMTKEEQIEFANALCDNDPICGDLTKKQSECVKCDILFTDINMTDYSQKYKQYKQNRKRAKREIYELLMYVLSHKNEFWIYETEQELIDEEFVCINDFLEVIGIHFSLEKKLNKLTQLQQILLLSGFNKNNTNNRVPYDISELIQQYLFEKPKYNYYNVDSWCIEKMVKKSKYLTLSKDSLYDDELSTGYYGVKLTDLQKKYDEDWRTMELSDNDSGIDEFAYNVDE
eukprot:275841_1